MITRILALISSSLSCCSSEEIKPIVNISALPISAPDLANLHMVRRAELFHPIDSSLQQRPAEENYYQRRVNSVSANSDQPFPQPTAPEYPLSVNSMGAASSQPRQSSTPETITNNIPSSSAIVLSSNNSMNTIRVRT